MSYLVSVKESKTAKPKLQKIMNRHTTLNLIVNIMVNFNGIEPTSADLRALKMMDELDHIDAKGIENTKNGNVIIIQKTA